MCVYTLIHTVHTYMTYIHNIVHMMYHTCAKISTRNKYIPGIHVLAGVRIAVFSPKTAKIY